MYCINSCSVYSSFVYSSFVYVPFVFLSIEIVPLISSSTQELQYKVKIDRTFFETIFSSANGSFHIVKAKKAGNAVADAQFIGVMEVGRRQERINTRRDAYVKGLREIICIFQTITLSFS